ncbi:hypothetical protein BZA77DRAFT_346729 [Pyronema omphalodes]|nr:hypothetical protein BZA77DRAFT_346729 [Pyronema omphalodes]
MDPLSLSASAAGLLSLAIEVTKILTGYISAVKSAPQDASELNTEMLALCHILEKLVEILRSDDDIGIDSEASFNDQSVLRSVISVCQEHITTVYKRIAKLRSTDKISRLVERMVWPLKKDECQQSVRVVHRYVQTLQVLLVASNRSLMSQHSAVVVSKLEEQHKRTTDSIEMMKENFIPIPDGMLQLSERISTVISIVSDLAQSNAEIKRISDGVTKLQLAAEGEELEKILMWISSLQPHKRHQAVVTDRLEDTGTWFLNKAEYVGWYSDEDSNPVLACYGMPGAGKSVMSSLVIDHLSIISHTDEKKSCVAYLYCDYRDEESQTAVRMIGALLNQILVTHSKHLNKEVFNSLKQRKRRSMDDLTIEETLRHLKLALRNFERVYICADALDECRDEQRVLFLNSLSNLSKDSKCSLRIFMTGRTHTQKLVEKSFMDKPISITIEANSEDIRRYVSAKLEKDDNYEDMDDTFKKDIIEKIVDTADGMFLLPALQIQTILEQTSTSKRRAALNFLPEKLDDAFQATIDRIMSTQSSAKSNQGMEVLKWAFLAERPLMIPELRHALASINKLPTDNFDIEDLAYEKSLLDCCYGLVVVDKQTSSIRLVHKSLQDYLKIQHDEKKIFETGQNDIARTCITYMSFSDKTTDSSDTATVATLIQGNPRNYRPEKVLRVSTHINKYPFLLYAIHFWGEHIRKGPNHQETMDLAVNLLLNRNNLHSFSLR